MVDVEYFENSGKYIDISSNKKIISSTNDEYNTAYSSIIIDPSKNQKYIWTFKIIKHSGWYAGIQIGIVQSSSSCLDTNFAQRDGGGKEGRKYYSYCSSNKKYSHNDCNGEKCVNEGYGANDLISMKLDFSKTNGGCGLLYFSKETPINNDSLNPDSWDLKKPYNIAFDSVDGSCKYKMAVSIKNASVELSGFLSLEEHENKKKDEKLMKNKESYEDIYYI